MGLFYFTETVGKKIFEKTPDETQTEDEKQMQAEALSVYAQSLGLEIDKLVITVNGQRVAVRGEVASQEIREKVLLALGNVEGIAEVDDTITVIIPAPEAKMHTVIAGDTLPEIAKTYYGNSDTYRKILEANQPMLSQPNEIYIGQVLRIPME